MTAANDWIIKEEEDIMRGQVYAECIHFPDLLKEDVPKLSCLSARIICCNAVRPYLHKLPSSLCRFVEMHSKERASIPILAVLSRH